MGGGQAGVGTANAVLMNLREDRRDYKRLPREERTHTGSTSKLARCRTAMMFRELCRCTAGLFSAVTPLLLLALPQKTR